MNDPDTFGFATQIRKSPYFQATVNWVQKPFQYITTCTFLDLVILTELLEFGELDANYVDVAVERQVEITGPDAAKFMQILTPRDLSQMAVGQCKYILITNEEGGIINDPVLLRLGENKFWISLADSDVLLWAQGVAVNSGLDVRVYGSTCRPCNFRGRGQWIS